MTSQSFTFIDPAGNRAQYTVYDADHDNQYLWSTDHGDSGIGASYAQAQRRARTALKCQHTGNAQAQPTAPLDWLQRDHTRVGVWWGRKHPLMACTAQTRHASLSGNAFRSFVIQSLTAATGSRFVRTAEELAVIANFLRRFAVNWIIVRSGLSN
jgi:hypothetical protein